MLLYETPEVFMISNLILGHVKFGWFQIQWEILCPLQTLANKPSPKTCMRKTGHHQQKGWIKTRSVAAVLITRGNTTNHVGFAQSHPHFHHYYWYLERTKLPRWIMVNLQLGKMNILDALAKTHVNNGTNSLTVQWPNTPSPNPPWRESQLIAQ